MQTPLFVGLLSTLLATFPVAARDDYASPGLSGLTGFLAGGYQCYLSPLWSHLDRGLMEPRESRLNGATEIAG